MHFIPVCLLSGQCEKSLRSAEEAAAAASRGREDRLERLAAVWDACEASGVKLGPSAFVESNHEQRNDFLPLADDDQVLRFFFAWFLENGWHHAKAKYYTKSVRGEFGWVGILSSSASWDK